MRRILQEALGKDLIEYALILGFIAVAAGAAVPTVSAKAGEMLERLTTLAR